MSNNTLQYYFPPETHWIWEVFPGRKKRDQVLALSAFLKKIPVWFGKLQGTDESETYQADNKDLVELFLKMEEVLSNSTPETSEEA
jgi:hypothetical protein